MKFKYTARTKDGEIKEGEISAYSRESAIDILQKYDIIVTSIAELRENPFFSKDLEVLNRVSSRELTVFSKQLAVMVDSKVPLSEALRALGQKTVNEFFKDSINEIASDISGGLSFTKALSRHPKIFDSFYLGMVKSGELSGKLSEVLKRLSEHLERDYYLKSRIIGALIYPAIILLAFFAIATFILIFVIPQLVEVFTDSGQELPLVTQIVIGASVFAQNYWWLILLLIGGIFVFFKFYTRTKEGRYVIDSILIKLPIFGKFLQNVYLARFAENLSALISAGIPIAKALETSSELIGNSVYENVILDTKERVIKGEGVTNSLERHSKFIPPLFVQMTAVGERTGNLGDALIQTTQFYREEVDIFVKSISSVIEPLLIIFLAVFVGILMAAVFLPLYQIQTQATMI